MTPSHAAITVASPYNSHFSVHELGSIAGLPTSYGGLVFKKGDHNTILIGGNANNTSGRFYEVPVVRDSNHPNRITGFGAPIGKGFGANNDGGISYGPGDVLFYSKYNINRIGQVKPGSNSEDKEIDLSPIGVQPSPGAIGFVPSGYPGQGRLKVSSYSSGKFYDVPYTPDGSGTYNLGSAALKLTIPGGPEGFIYMPKSAPGFDAAKDYLLVTLYGSNKVVAYEVDGEGNPVLSSVQDFIVGLTGGDGAAIDPVSGDFLFSTFGSPNQVVRVQGFTPPPPAAAVALSTSDSPAAIGSGLTFTAAVTGNAPTGTVTFQDGSTNIPGCVNVALTSGQAACFTSSLALGGHVVSAFYNGDNNNGAASANVNQQINPPANNPPVAGFGHSLRFDGSNDFVDITPYNPPTGDFTIEFWVKPNNLDPNYKGFFGHDPGSTSNRAPSMWQHGSTWHCDMYKSDNSRYEVEIPNVFQAAGEWVHLAWVKNGDTMYYYRNGVQIHTRTAPPNGTYKTTTTLWFGKVDNYYDANFDEMRIWSLARTQQQINDYRYRYIANPNTESGLTHYWTLDEGSGTTVTDLITGGNNGTLQNGPVWQDAATQPPITTPEDTPVSNYLKASDRDHDPLTFSFVTQPTKGVVTLNDPTTGRYTYTPNLNATGSDSFTYKVNDGQADSNTATITVTITPINDVPVGTADHYTVGEDGVLTATTVLANDHDDDGDHLSAKPGPNPGHGTLNLDADGTFTYTPVADYNGPDSFTYLPNDGHADGAAVTVSITVTPANDLPLANGDTYSIAEDGVLTVSALGVLVNDSDKEANPLTAVFKTGPGHGVLALHADGSFTYTPTANYNGLDSFTYAAHDGTGEGNIATVAITVNAQNDAPMGAPDSYTLMEDAVLQILVPGLLGNDSDPDGDSLRVAQGPSILTTAPVHGVLKAMGNDGSFTYQPSANYNGPDSFTYVVTDGKAQSAPVTVNLIIRAQNDAPSSANDSYTVAHNATLKVSAKKGVLKNDSDTDGDVLRSLVVSQPTRGLLHMQLDGSFTYNPPSGNCNADSTDAFTYWANDGAADSNVATVNITIHCVNRAPVANGDVYSVQQGVQLAIPAPGLMVNDSDPDGNQLTAVLVTQPTRGALGFNPNGGFVYKAPTAGADSFTYKVTDGALDSSVVTVSINVTATNQVPLAGNDSYRTSKNVALQVSAPGVLGNDIDADGNTLTPTVMAQPTHGSLHMNLDGSFIYTPSNNYVGLDSFVYVAHDGSAPSNAATVTIDVANANFAPVAANDSYSTAYNVTLTVPGPGLLANDSDPDANQPLRVVVASQPTKGTLALGVGVGGGFTYTPTGGVCASDSADSFTYYANDSVVNSNLATASIAIHCTNRAPVAVADSYTVAQGARLAIPAPGVLVNDADPDGNPITLIDATLTTRGAFAPSSDGSFVYIALSNFSGTDTFTYKATDGALKSAAVTVSINVTAVNQVPLAGNDSYSTNKNLALQVAGPGVQGNDSDPDGNVLTVQVMAQPTHGTLAMNTNGSFSYTPTNNYVGLDSFTYVAHDGIAPSNVATVTINVSDANFAPVANDDSYSTPYNAKLSVAGPGLLANDRDPDGNQPLMVVVATQPTKGTLSLTSGGGFEYTPTNTGTCASDSTDSFTYYANDSVVNSNLATVTLTLHCTNRAPVAHADNYSIAQSGTLAIPAPGVLVNDSDPDGNPLRMVLVSGPTLGAFAPNADGSFSYVAPNSAARTASPIKPPTVRWKVQ